MATEAQIIGRLQKAQAKDLLKRGFKVQARAKVLLSGTAGHPKRVDTGLLRSSVRVELRTISGSPIVRIGTNRKTARWVHDGTGIYGPHRTLIKPRRAKVLSWQAKGKKRIFAKTVKGMRKNEFLKDALPAAKL